MPFDPQPILTSPLLTLRPLQPSDFDRLYAVAADPLIWEQHPDKTRSQPGGFQIFFQQALDSRGALLALETDSGRVIGSSRFHNYDEAAGEVEIGWTFLARSHWGGQYNAEMKRLMLEHAFRFVGRVVFLIDPANYRSQRAVEKLGAVRTGMRADGSGRPSVVFAITPSQWRARARPDATPELRCKALLFDMDGVLVDSRAIVERTWRRWAARHGIEAEPLLRIAHGRRPEDTLQAAVPHLALAEEVAWLQAAELADTNGLIAIPGAARLLASISGVPWAVVTSAGPELAPLRLMTAGLPIPPVIVSSTDVSRGKPAPDGYLLAAARLGVDPADAVVFEDAPAGVAAGLAAGCVVIGVATTHTEEQLAGAAVVIPDLASVKVRADADRWRILL